MHIKNTYITKLLLIFRYLIKVQKAAKFSFYLTFTASQSTCPFKSQSIKKPRKKDFRGLVFIRQLTTYYSTVTDFARLRG